MPEFRELKAAHAESIKAWEK